jgi:hypothetical protein
MNPTLLLCALLVLLAAACAASAAQDGPGVGYRDTPYLPDGRWRVHDADRPVPPVVTPGRDAAPPSDAVVLFDGGDLGAWTREGEQAPWPVRDGAMVAGGGDIASRESFGDCQLHVEWAAPAEVKGESQARGNSGVFLMGRYEVQVLDSYESRTYADGQAGALYGQEPPLVNACRPPGEWQSYDIVFRAPRFENGQLVAPAVMTVFHNGVLVHHARPLLGPTRHRDVASYRGETESSGPIVLQDHGDPVRFRNLWVRRLQLP